MNGAEEKPLRYRNRREGQEWLYCVDQAICCDTKINTGEDYSINNRAGIKLVALSGDGFLTVLENYCWDGSTAVPDTSGCMFASLVHDALYQMMRLEYGISQEKMGAMKRSEFREKADWLYYAFCVANGMWRPRAWLRWKGVRLFGKRFTMQGVWWFGIFTMPGKIFKLIKILIMKTSRKESETAPANGACPCKE